MAMTLDVIAKTIRSIVDDIKSSQVYFFTVHLQTDLFIFTIKERRISISNVLVNRAMSIGFGRPICNSVLLTASKKAVAQTE